MSLKTAGQQQVSLTDNVTHPLVSIIMPVRNEAGYISVSLESIARQSYPRDRMQVFVVDGMSDDDTRRIAREVAEANGLDLAILDNPGKIAPSGLNVGLSRAEGEVIIRVDGHCELDRDYVANCVEVLASGRAEGVGGPIETIGEGAVAEAIAIAMSSKFGVGGSAFRTVNDREMYTDTVAFPGYTRETIQAAGRFDEELVRNQDDEYNFRIRELGGRILLSPSIRSRYFSRGSIRSLRNQYFQYGYWKVRVLQLHPRQMSPRQFVPFIFVTTLLVLGFASLFSVFALWATLAVTVSYLIANLGASVVAGRETPARVPLIALSFLVIHISYGLGSLFGLLAFRKRWREPKTTRPRLVSD